MRKLLEIYGKASARESNSSYGQARKEQRRLKGSAKRWLYLGDTEEASKRSSEAGRNSTRIMDEAGRQAESRRDSFDDVRKSYEDIHEATKEAYRKVAMEHYKNDQKSEQWRNKGKDAQFAKKVISGINKGVAFVGRFRAEFRIDRAEIKAKQMAVDGRYADARTTMRKAEARSVRTLKFVGALNKGARVVADVGIKLSKLPPKLIKALDTIGNKNIELDFDEGQLYTYKSQSTTRMYSRADRRGRVIQDLRESSEEFNRRAKGSLMDYEPLVPDEKKSLDDRSKNDGSRL